MQTRQSVTDEEFFMHIPMGFKFNPTDHELVVDYLMKKANNERLPRHRIVDVDLYQYHPDQLTDDFKELEENQWYFFTRREKKYPNGTRPNRAAGNGFWKATGSDKKIEHEGVLVGLKKSLVYHSGKPPTGVKTQWLMLEYTLAKPHRTNPNRADMMLDDWALCKVYTSARKSAAATIPQPRLSLARENNLDVDAARVEPMEMHYAVQNQESGNLNGLMEPMKMNDAVPNQEDDNLNALIDFSDLGDLEWLQNVLSYTHPSVEYAQEAQTMGDCRYQSEENAQQEQMMGGCHYQSEEYAQQEQMMGDCRYQSEENARQERMMAGCHYQSEAYAQQEQMMGDCRYQSEDYAQQEQMMGGCHYPSEGYAQQEQMMGCCRYQSEGHAQQEQMMGGCHYQSEEYAQQVRMMGDCRYQLEEIAQQDRMTGGCHYQSEEYAQQVQMTGGCHYQFEEIAQQERMTGGCHYQAEKYAQKEQMEGDNNVQSVVQNQTDIPTLQNHDNVSRNPTEFPTEAPTSSSNVVVGFQYTAEDLYVFAHGPLPEPQLPPSLDNEKEEEGGGGGGDLWW